MLLWKMHTPLHVLCIPPAPGLQLLHEMDLDGSWGQHCFLWPWFGFPPWSSRGASSALPSAIMGFTSPGFCSCTVLFGISRESREASIRWVDPCTRFSNVREKLITDCASWHAWWDKSQLMWMAKSFVTRSFAKSWTLRHCMFSGNCFISHHKKSRDHRP